MITPLKNFYYRKLNRERGASQEKFNNLEMYIRLSFNPSPTEKIYSP